MRAACAERGRARGNIGNGLVAFLRGAGEQSVAYYAGVKLAADGYACFAYSVYEAQRVHCVLKIRVVFLYNIKRGVFLCKVSNQLMRQGIGQAKLEIVRRVAENLLGVLIGYAAGYYAYAAAVVLHAVERAVV